MSAFSASIASDRASGTCAGGGTAAPSGAREPTWPTGSWQTATPLARALSSEARMARRNTSLHCRMQI
jgi:hypothetical protein